jgi:hypothetical protein
MPVERVGPLTISQRRMWLRGYFHGQGDLDPGWVTRWELPEGPSVDACIAAFVELVRRHEILRTTFHLGTDGEPVQMVHEVEGFLSPITVTNSLETPACDGRRPTLVGISTSRPWWSLRLEATSGRVYRSSLIFDHIISDGGGLRTLRNQFDRLLRGEDPPRPTVQPIDRAALEQSRIRRAETPRRDPFVLGPQLICPPQRMPADPGKRYLSSTAAYPGLTALVDRVSSDARVSRSTVMLTALVDLLCRFGGVPGVNVATYLNHRVGPDVDIECETRPVDVYFARRTTLPVREALVDAQRLLLDAYADDFRLGPVTLATRTRTNVERGVGATVPFFYDYQELEQPQRSGDRRPATLGAVSFSDIWEPWGRPGYLFLYVYVRGDEVIVQFELDTWLIEQNQAEQMLRVIPEILQSWVAQPSTALEQVLVNSPVTLSTATLSNRGWVDTDTLRKLLVELTGRADSTVVCETGRVVVMAAAGPEEFERWHVAIAGRITEHLDVLLPDEYQSLTSGVSWSPTQRTARPPATTMERLLCEVIAEVTAFAVRDVGCTFIDAGVDMEDGPAIVESLARERVRGCSSVFFSAPIPLSEVAQRLWIDESPLSMAPVYIY